LQSANHELGVLHSQLRSQDELMKQIKKDKEEVDKNFEKFKKKHNLIIKSKDLTIAKLEQQIDGGNSGVDLDPSCDDFRKCVVGYSWSDHLGRFKLLDPNIFEPDNEVFTANQLFKIYGEVWSQKDGSLQIRRLVLREVYLGEDGEYKPIIDAKAEIVDSDFQYHNPPPDPRIKSSWLDLFRLRGIALGSVTAFPDIGQTKLGLGLEFFSVSGFGINTHTALDFRNIKKTEQRLGVEYSPSIFGVDLNVAIGFSAGTSFMHMFKDYSLNVDVLFYLNN